MKKLHLKLSAKSIVVNIESYSKKLVKLSLSFIGTNYQAIRCIRKQFFSVLKSPHIHKKAQNQIGLYLYKTVLHYNLTRLTNKPLLDGLNVLHFCKNVRTSFILAKAVIFKTFF